MDDYKKIDSEDIAFFTDLCGSEHLFIGDEICCDFCHDELSGMFQKPEIHIRVKSAKQISRIMRYAGEKHIPVTVRGSGTGLVGGAVPVCGGILLDLSKMNHIISLDKQNMTVTVEPGVLLMELSQFAESNGLFYPPDPGEKTATIGGNISTNAGGMRAVKYGVTRDYVRELEVVLPSGEIVYLGGKVVKNSSGYDLKDLIVGSEGTLGIVTKATMRLIALPKHKISLLIPFPDLSSAIQTVPKLICSNYTPTAVEFMERDVILAAEQFQGRNFPDNSADAYLLLTFDGMNKEQIEIAYENAARVCLDSGAIDVFISDTQERNEAIWTARSSFLEAIKSSTTEMDECDVVVPIGEVADFILYSRELQEKYQIRILSFGHAGDGNLHIYILRDQLEEEKWHDTLQAVFEDLYAKSRELNGLVSGEHGIGYAKKSYLAKSASPEVQKLMRGIKGIFDPGNILNPLKVLP